MRGIIPGWFRIYMDKYMNLLDFLIAPAHAQVVAAAAPQGLGGFGLLMPIALIAVMYFLMIRPQMKRAKEHRAMLEKLSKGDEVITSGGIAGTVTDIGDNFITVEVAAGVRIRVQKAAVGNVLPKGTLKST
jgi:preprotein translocase subunit YajC